MPYTKIRLICTNNIVRREAYRQLRAYLDDRDECVMPPVEAEFTPTLLELRDDPDAFTIFVRVHKDQLSPAIADITIDAVDDEELDFEEDLENDEEFETMMKHLNPPPAPAPPAKRPHDDAADTVVLPAAKRARIVDKLQAAIPFARPEILKQAVDAAFPDEVSV